MEARMLRRCFALCSVGALPYEKLEVRRGVSRDVSHKIQRALSSLFSCLLYPLMICSIKGPKKKLTSVSDIRTSCFSNGPYCEKKENEAPAPSYLRMLFL
jgi:hypothetical protein